MKKVINITFAGLGGQGVLKSTDILGEAAFRAGFDIKKSEVHGMSQRGGSVCSEVRYGRDVASPMVPEGETDFLIVLDETQIPVNRHKLKAGGIMITPADINTECISNKKTLNVALCGALSKHLEIAEEHWLGAIKYFLPEKVHEVNIQTFRATAS
ncbi:2-oxoacid:acceptor oxidoreductase family protein [Lentisphaerota bacterium ZTH]|nr:2-oxoacid:acceptor oxidoreductase family protein [Lentisphaerota bacterium]WET07249.1 2-oxoacid:acceptor oxidoreductase family protein [Lentisphaerota bacterium ZTH]